MCSLEHFHRGMRPVQQAPSWRDTCSPHGPRSSPVVSPHSRDSRQDWPGLFLFLHKWSCCGFYLWWLVALNSVFVRAFHVVCVTVVHSFSSLTRLLCGWPVSRFGLMSVQLWTFFYVFFGEHTCTFLMGDTYVWNCQIVGYVNIQVYFTLAIIF